MRDLPSVCGLLDPLQVSELFKHRLDNDRDRYRLDFERDLPRFAPEFGAAPSSRRPTKLRAASKPALKSISAVSSDSPVTFSCPSAMA
jgi:hypothetical protein